MSRLPRVEQDVQLYDAAEQAYNVGFVIAAAEEGNRADWLCRSGRGTWGILVTPCIPHINNPPETSFPKSHARIPAPAAFHVVDADLLLRLVQASSTLLHMVYCSFRNTQDKRL